jgi:hypothetical protein
MSKMGQAFLEMQEDVANMTLEEFIEKYGAENADLYDQLWDYFPDDTP